MWWNMFVKKNLKKRGFWKLLVLFLYCVPYSRIVVANNFEMSDAFYCGKGTVSCRAGLKFNFGNDRLQFFNKINIFYTRPFTIGGQEFDEARNFGYELGIDYKFFTFNKSNFYISPSYYKAFSYKNELLLIGVDDIYKRINIKVEYNYAIDYFSAIASYGKLFDSYKNYLEFDVKKSLIKNKYLANYIGYTHRHDIKTANEYSYVYNNIIYRIRDIDKLLNNEYIFYYEMKIRFSKFLGTSLRAGRTHSNIYGNYYSWAVKLNHSLY
jgi:hypothetical protein